MGWRFRKSKSVGPVRVNLSKKGAGFSFGIPGFRVGKSADGRRYFSFGIPGTGLYHIHYFGKNKKNSTNVSSKSKPVGNQVSSNVSKPSRQHHWWNRRKASNMIEQTPFGTDSFAENPEPRCPCILLLDTSYSMEGTPILELNKGITHYKDELAADSLAAKRVEIAIVTFGGDVETICDFSTAESFFPPELSVNGATPMGAAITHAVDMIEDRKEAYKESGISYYRPWIFLITDGAPTDEWQSAAVRVKEGEEHKKFMFFAVGVEGANFDILKQIVVREPLKLKGLRFRDLFLWLSSSQKSVSRSTPGDAVPLESPTGPEGWATTA